jgi:hypothetical protein
MIKRFDSIEGLCIDPIVGQDRFGYARSDGTDFYDLMEWAQRGGYQGSELLIYDFDTGKVSKPFARSRNVVYGAPVYVEGYLYFLQGDYDQKKITLYQYLPEHVLEPVTQFNMDEVSLYQLKLIGEPLHVISQDPEAGFRCYYPTQISFPLQEHESVILIEDGRVYLEKWVEEGWDEEQNCATDAYRYENWIIIKDVAGNTISEEIGCLNQSPDGNWWIS